MSNTLEVYAVPLTVLDDASSWEEIRARADRLARRMVTASPWVDQAAAADSLRRAGLHPDDLPDGWWHRPAPATAPVPVPDGWRVAAFSPDEARALAERYPLAVTRVRGSAAGDVSDYLDGLDLVLATLAWLGERARAAGAPEPGLIAILRPTDA
jgi:hypothetical protein